MAIAYVGADTAATNGTADHTLTLPGGTAEDDICLVASGANTSGDANMTVGTSGYTELVDIHTSDCNLGVFWKRQGATPDSTVSVGNPTTITQECASALVQVFSGVDTTTAIDATTTSTTGTSGAPDSPSITTATNGAFVVSMATSAAFDTAVTAPTGYSNQDDDAANDFFDATIGAASKEVATAGAENPAAWTGWNSARWAAASVALRPATSGAYTIYAAGDSYTLTGQDATLTYVGSGPTQAFEILRGQTTFSGGSTTATITESTHYTLPSGGDSTNCFIKLVNTRLSGMGNNSAGGNSDLDDFTVNIQNPDNIATSITFERYGSTNTNHVNWEIWCYVGTGGGDNEFIVRDVDTVAGANTGTLTGTTVTTISDNSDVVVFITGQSTSEIGRNDWHAALFTSSLVANASDWDPTFSRVSTASHTSRISYAVVEFVGSNWTVDRVQSDSTVTAWAISDNTSGTVAHGVTISDVAKAAIVESQYSTSNDTTGLDDAGDSSYLDSATNIRLWNKVTAGTRRKVWWILQNSQADATARNLKVQHIEFRDDTTSGAEPRQWTETISTGADSGTGAALTAGTDETSIIATTSVDGSGTAYPRGSIDVWLSGTDQLTFRESDNGQERRTGIEIIEWPEDPGGSTAYDLVADAGSYSLTGQDASLEFGAVLSADAGTYTYTGQDAVLSYGTVLDAESGSYTYTGTSTDLLYGAVLDASGGSYLLTGADAGLNSGRVVEANSGSYALTGADSALNYGIVLIAEGGSYALTGADAELLAARILSADGGSYALTGQGAGLNYGTILNAEGGSYTLTGQDVAFLRGLLLDAGAGAYTLTGTDVALQYGSNTVLAAETGAYTVTGAEAALLFNKTLTAEGGSYTLTGQDAALTHGTSSSEERMWLLRLRRRR